MKGEGDLESSRTYYGGTFLNDEDLAESTLKHKIELEYYTIKTYNNEVNEEAKRYGIGIVKKEYEEENVKIESNNHNNISNNIYIVNELIDTLKRGKVTPIGLDDIMDDLYKERITE